jgi:solute carrier family 25 (mitochondrial carnitine/acylcarnitine transporter), member 20/29
MSRDNFLKYREYVPKLVATEGFTALYKGFWATFWRDMPAWAAYFYFYAAFKELFGKLSAGYLDESKQKRIVFFEKVMAGGLAGCGSWLVSYPFDIVKT